MDESFISMAFKQMGVAVKGIKVIKSKTTGYDFSSLFYVYKIKMYLSAGNKLIEFKNVIQLYLYCYENGDIWREIA